jgi:hypothetical protein
LVLIRLQKLKSRPSQKLRFAKAGQYLTKLLPTKLNCRKAPNLSIVPLNTGFKVRPLDASNLYLLAAGQLVQSCVITIILQTPLEDLLCRQIMIPFQPMQCQHTLV